MKRLCLQLYRSIFASFKNSTSREGLSLRLICFDLIRVYIGLGLFIKGIEFMVSPVLLEQWISSGQINVFPTLPVKATLTFSNFCF